MRYLIHGVVKEPDIGGALINLDQEENFDRVDHHYFEAVLRATDCVPVFHCWIAVLYSGISLVISVNGHLTKPFTITRLIREGRLLVTSVRIDSRAITKEAGDDDRHHVSMGCSRGMSTYSNHVTVIVSSPRHIDLVGKTRKNTKQ